MAQKEDKGKRKAAVEAHRRSTAAFPVRFVCPDKEIRNPVLLDIWKGHPARWAME